MTKHYEVMMVELKSWTLVTSAIIIDAWQTDQNSNRENKWTEHLNQGMLEYYTFREPYFSAYAVRIFTSNAFSICLDGHFKAFKSSFYASSNSHFWQKLEKYPFPIVNYHAFTEYYFIPFLIKPFLIIACK